MAKQRFYLLDGLRGVAAIAVVLFHCSPGLPELKPWFQSGYLAVDFFFMLSGFVIAHAYEDRLKCGMSFGRFAEVRIIRLYPLYILGCAIGFFVAATESVHAQKLWIMRDATWDLPWAIFMLPKPAWDIGRNFALNPPAWSLFFEIIINLVYAAFLIRLKNLYIVILVILAFLVMVGQAVGVRYGFDEQGYALVASLPRPLFAFPAGVLVYRFWLGGHFSTVRVSPIFLYFVFTLTLLGLIRGEYAPYISLVVSSIAFPLLIVVGATCAGALKPNVAAAHLGDFSYPVYAIHLPILTAATTLFTWLHYSLHTSYLIGIVLLPFIAWSAGRYYDSVVRRMLIKRLHLRRRDVVSAPAL